MSSFINAFGRTFGLVVGVYAGYRAVKWCEGYIQRTAEEAGQAPEQD